MGLPRCPCLIALVSISWSTRKATTSSSGGSGCWVPTSVATTSWPEARTPSTRLSRLPCRLTGAAVPLVVLSTCRTSCSEVRAVVAMLVIVCFRAPVSASSRYCADSAWARITASEWPTTSCTSRASRAWSSRSRAISAAWSRSASAATWETCDSDARAEKRSARPASHGTPSTDMPSSAAVICQRSLNRDVVSTREPNPAVSSAA
jgi:hypothetical protein